MSKRKQKIGTNKIKRLALRLYLEGFRFRSVDRILKFSHVSIYKWIKSYGENLKELHSNHTNIRIVEIDEMHSYISSKKTTVGFGLLLIRYEKRFISFIIGCKGIKTGKKLWNTMIKRVLI